MRVFFAIKSILTAPGPLGSFGFFVRKSFAKDLEAIRIAAQQDKEWWKPVFLKRLANSLDRIVVPFYFYTPESTISGN